MTENARAALMMVASMAAFAFEDLFIKRGATNLPPGQVIVMMGIGGTIAFWIIAAIKGQRVLVMDALKGAPLLRSVAEGTAAMVFVTALALTPLTFNAALLQAAPLVVTMGAALFLREPVGWRRWTAIGVGFMGVLIILRPGVEGFHWAGLFTVVCVILMSVRDLSTRAMKPHIGTFQLTTWAYISYLPAGVALMLIQGDHFAALEPAMWIDTIGMIIFGMIGYYLVTLAMRIGEVSFVAPFRYARLIFAMILGIIFLGERPDLLTMIGSAIVIGSGLYTFWRQAVRRRPSAPVN